MPPRRKGKKPEGDCVIPSAMPAEALGEFVLKADDERAESIRSYVEHEARGEKVRHLEKVATESIFGQPMEAWDVQTDKNRWWVITHPTNLYSQQLFPSLDYTISFHVGLTTRMHQAEMCQEQEQAHDRINLLWDRLARARSALFEGKKAEDFQSVGMKCRETLVLLVQSLAQAEMVPAGQEKPHAADVVHWAEHIANHVARGSSNERIRSYLKTISKETWQLVNWLTHAQNAGRPDGWLATDATENVLQAFIAAWARHEGPKQAAKREQRSERNGQRRRR